MAYSQESRIQNLIDDLYDDREIALNKLLKINNPSLQTLISKNALLRDRVGGLTLAEWSQVQNQLKYTPSGRIRTFGAETFEASSEMNKQCVECENMVAATDGDNYFVCDACVERMGAEGEGKTRTFKITNITYDTYDEEAEEHQTQEDLELPTEMVVQIELQGDEEEWEIYDLLTYQIENQGYGWLVESFDFDTESKSAEDYEAEQKKLHPGLYRYKGKIGLRKGWTECQECDDLVKLNDINWYYIAGYGQATVCDVCVGKYNYKKDRLSKGHKHGELALLMFMKEDREAKEKMWKEQLIEPDSDHEHPDGDYGERMGISEDYVIQPFEGEDLEFTDWANQETKHHGKTSLKDWADHEIKKHGGKMSFQDWAKHEDKSHIDRYGAERVRRWQREYYLMSRRLMIICRKCNPDGDSGPFLEMRDGTIICPRCEDELYLPGDPVWDEFGAENWGGDPEGKLAQALAKARKKAKKVGKTLKIEKLGAETSGAKAEREDSWEKGVIRLAISDGCFSDEYAEWVLRQIDGPYATMNHPRFEGISYWDKVISQAETSGQWEIGEQLEEAQMNAEEWVCSCEEGEDCEDTCTVCENCGVRTITAHTPFADEEDWPNREERVKAAKGKYTWYEDKGCDYCGEWIPEEAGWKHDLEGVFVPRIEMKSFKRAEDEPTCPECGKEETWDIENYICEDCGYVDCDICGMGLEINEHPESSSAMVSLDGSGFETEAYLAWNNMNQVCKLCYEDVIEPQYDGWGKCNTCGRNHPPNPHYDGRYGNEQASHHKEWCKEHKNYPQEDLTDKIRQRDEELERQEKEWAVKREKKRLRLEKWKKDREDEIKSMGWLKRKWYGLAESNDCPFCSGKIDFEEAYIELPRSLCEGCYDAVMEKRHDHAYSAESFSAPTKGIDTFTKPFEEMALDNSIGKSIVVGFVIGGLALFGYNKWK